jgi:hypothetical protein
MNRAIFWLADLLYLSKGRENSRTGQKTGELGCSPRPQRLRRNSFSFIWHRCEKNAGEGGVLAAVRTTDANNRCEQMAGTLDAARSELEKAGERQREIDGLIAVENKKLEALEAERKVKGRGRPNTSHSSKVKAAGAKIARLMRNILPSEQAPYVPRTMLELVSSAAKHPQHHAAAGAVPAGRRSDAKRSRDADDDDDDDDEAGGGCDDDDGESTEFRQY